MISLIKKNRLVFCTKSIVVEDTNVKNHSKLVEELNWIDRMVIS
jgi:hypothetical protein